MGFDVNFHNEPIIKQAQATKDGGAGNLGYFQREHDEENKKKEAEKSVFDEKGKNKDTFEKGDATENEFEDFSLTKLIAQIILSVKDWFKKVFKA